MKKMEKETKQEKEKEEKEKRTTIIIHKLPVVSKKRDQLHKVPEQSQGDTSS